MRPNPATSLALAAVVLFGMGALMALDPPSSDARAAPSAVDYEGRRADSISGLDDVRQLCHPAVVDYAACLESTPQHARLVREGIDPSSALGQILMSEARRRVTGACTVVMKRLDHCSVWRELRRSDGAAIPDRTDEVCAEIAGEEAGD